MFSWVCPTCGKELDIGTKVCPNCAGRAEASAAAGAAGSNRRFWAGLGLAALVGVALLAGLARYQSRPRAATAQLEAPARSKPLPPPEPVPEAPAPAKDLPPPQPVASPVPEWARHVEIAGVRTFYDAQNKPRVRAVIINHGEDELSNTVFTVALRPAQAAPDSSPLARFTVKLTAPIKPGDFREVQAPLDALATLAAFPPWRQLRADLESR